jgi:transketolase
MYYSENKENILEYKKDHYQDNKSKYLERAKNWRENNCEKYQDLLKEWRLENPNYSKEYLEVWFKENPTKRVEYGRSHRINNPHIVAWRSTLKLAITRLGGKKENSTIELLGYSAEDLKSHMNRLFKENMSWENWGEWHVDHIIPVSKFDPNTPMSVVNALDNLQPLWAFDNLSKNNNIS